MKTLAESSTMLAPPEQLHSIWTMFDGLRAYARVSAAPAQPGRLPIVLVHGLSVSSRYMAPIARRLAPYHPVYAPDLPGFGKSERPDAILDICALADALARWMDFWGLERAALLGNSMGCQIIADLAMRYPGRVTHAILIGPTVDRCARTLLAQASRLLINITHEPIASILTQGRDYWICGLHRTVATFRRALEDRIEDKLPAMRFPTLVARGAYDPIAPERWCAELARWLPDGRLVVIPHAPHAANYDAPAALARIVLEFLGTDSLAIDQAA
jgi:pimeloyl-ACP methyl ester carboxylesterase